MTLPLPSDSNEMEQVCDLIDAIASTSVYQDISKNIRTVRVSCAKDGHTLVVSMNSILFFFYFDFDDIFYSVTLYDVIKTDTLIYSLAWRGADLLVGDENGALYAMRTSVAEQPITEKNQVGIG